MISNTINYKSVSAGMSEKLFYEINIDEQYTFAKFNGEISAEDIIHVVNKIRNDARFNPTFNSIADLTEASIKQEFSEASSITSFIKTTYHQRGYFRLAFVTGKNSSDWVGILKAISNIEDTPALINSFSSLKEAQAWVTEVT